MNINSQVTFHPGNIRYNSNNSTSSAKGHASVKYLGKTYFWKFEYVVNSNRDREAFIRVESIEQSIH